MVKQSILFCQLRQNQRSSQPILDFAEYMITHAFPHSYLTLKMIPSNDSFSGLLPQWIEVKNVDCFLEFLESNTLKEKEDVMIISWDSLHLEIMLENYCQKQSWKYCHRHQVRGSEASTVIIYDFEQFSYESFTRAKHQLIIVTVKDKKTDLRYELQTIKDSKPTTLNRYCKGKHNDDHCNITRKKHDKWFGTFPPLCKYQTNPERIHKLIQQDE